MPHNYGVKVVVRDHAVRRSQTLSPALVVLLAFAALCVATPASALEGFDHVFDPSSIIKLGNTYHTYVDGQGIIDMTSTDMVNWASSDSVFGAGSGPAWIQQYAPGFAGYFWAPEITVMGGKYYLYYACSGTTNGDQCIGCATSPDLVHWSDQGMVVYATAATTWGGIDPSICETPQGRYWLTFGSWRSGIYDVEVNPATGKPIGSNYHNITHVPESVGSPTCSEASKMIYHGGYYYCFFNQGTCCTGIGSTYTIWVARSLQPTGPFTGDRVFVAPDAPKYAPGQFGYFVENGVDYCTYHFDDGNSNGYPRLFISHVVWKDGWPIDTPNWIPNGTYKVIGEGSGLAWTDGTGGYLQPLTQSPYTGATNQQFVFTSLGGNQYEIETANSTIAVDAYGCSGADGTKLDVYPYWSAACQQWNIYRASDGSYVLSTYNGGGNGTDVIDVPGASLSSGTQLDLWSYNGGTNQKWLIEAP